MKLDLLINISRGELLIEKEILEMVENKKAKYALFRRL